MKFMKPLKIIQNYYFLNNIKQPIKIIKDKIYRQSKS